MIVNVELGACHVTFAVCAAGCVMSGISAMISDSLRSFFMCSDGVCPAGIFTSHMKHSFDAVFIATTILSATFGYDALAALLRCLNVVIHAEQSTTGRLIMYLTHVSNVVLGSFCLAACYSNSFVFDSTYSTLKGADINKLKLLVLALFILSVGSALFQHALHVARARERAVRKAATLGNMTTFVKHLRRASIGSGAGYSMRNAEDANE